MDNLAFCPHDTEGAEPRSPAGNRKAGQAIN